ncbi:hypothetical protein BDZ45DRAFT_753394 [Acephala macrosclerotiorum]|nr:hypothetical protein BDZ45DRAFT_753394 [Acephala macrosclerotiorum]
MVSLKLVIGALIFFAGFSQPYVANPHGQQQITNVAKKHNLQAIHCSIPASTVKFLYPASNLRGTDEHPICISDCKLIGAAEHSLTQQQAARAAMRHDEQPGKTRDKKTGRND